MNINNFKITKNEPRINKYKGIKLEDDRVPYILDNYTQIKEVKELPSLDYTGEVYIHGSLADLIMSSLAITENPVDAQKFGKIFLKASQIFFVPTRNELPAEGIDGCGYVIMDEKLVYVYSAEQKQYQNESEEFLTEYGFVIGTDKSIVGTMDIERTLGWEDGTIGVYLIVSEPEDVSTSTIYKKEIMTEGGSVNTNYVFGEKIDMITVENQEAFQTKFQEILKSKGFNNELITNLLILSTGFTLASVNLDFTNDINNHTLSINMYDNGKYIYKNNQIIQSLGQTEPIEKEFNTIDELYNFINNLLIEVSNKNEELKQMIDSMAANNLEYKYTNEPLNDNNLFLNVVEGPIEPKGTGVYQYYIYNGKEYIELGGKSGGATENIVKEINLTSLSINDAIQQMKTITFTKEEAIKLSTTSNLVILTNIDNGNSIKTQVINSFYNKEVMIGSDSVSIIFKDLYWLVFEEATLLLSILQDTSNTDTYKFNAVIITSINIDTTSIQVSDWEADTTYSTYGYNYKATVHSNGPLYLNEGQVNVIFGMEEAVSGNFAPYVKVEQTQFTIYAKEKPTKEITFDYEVISR